MSRQTSFHPADREEPLRGGKKRKRSRPWILQTRAAPSSSGWRKRRFANWWTHGRYETEAQAEAVKAKLERELVAHMWERRIVKEET